MSWTTAEIGWDIPNMVERHRDCPGVHEGWTSAVFGPQGNRVTRHIVSQSCAAEPLDAQSIADGIAMAYAGCVVFTYDGWDDVAEADHWDDYPEPAAVADRR